MNKKNHFVILKKIRIYNSKPNLSGIRNFHDTHTHTRTSHK